MDSTKYIGMDVHKEAISIAVMNFSGRLVMESILETKAGTILQFMQGLRGNLEVTFEEGTWAAWLYNLLRPHVGKVIVCYRNTLTLFRDVCARSNGNNVPLIATDGFKFYRQVVRRLFGAACVYGQVIKKRRNDRVVRVQRKASFGAAWRWDEVWRNSEDSRQRNTAYMERLNLTIRQGSAYLCRRSLGHARRKQRLEDHLDLLRCQYNFLRPHRALKFGREVRTPAIQAGLTKQRLTFRDIFTSSPKFLRLARAVCAFIFQAKPTGSDYFAISIAA